MKNKYFSTNAGTYKALQDAYFDITNDTIYVIAMDTADNTVTVISLPEITLIANSLQELLRLEGEL